MTDEEMAEEYCNEKCKDCYMCSYSEHKNPYKVCQRRKDRKQAYLAGLKAGKDMNVSTKWHKVADGDYPPCEYGDCSINVLTDGGDIAYYDYNEDCWVVEPASVEIDPPIAWCEIPYTEE